MILAVISYWVVGVPASYFLAFKVELGGTGIWWGQVAALSVAALLLQARFWWVMLPLQAKVSNVATIDPDTTAAASPRAAELGPTQGFGIASSQGG